MSAWAGRRVFWNTPAWSVMVVCGVPSRLHALVALSAIAAIEACLSWADRKKLQSPVLIFVNTIDISVSMRYNSPNFIANR